MLRYVLRNPDTSSARYVTDVYPYVGRDGILSYLGALNQNLYVANLSLRTLASSYVAQTWNEGVMNTYQQLSAPLSLMDQIQIYGNNITKNLGALQYVFADNTTILAKTNNSGQTSSVITNFTGSGNASASVSDFADIASASSSVKNGIGSNASVSDVLGVFNNNDGFGWFSQATLNSLDNTGNNRLLKSTNSGNDNPMYNKALGEILQYMGVE